MTEPVSLSEAKAACRIEPEDTEEDAFLEALIAAARAAVEQATGQLLVRREVTETFPGFSPAVPLKAWPAPEGASVAYIAADGASQTIAEVRLFAGRWKPQLLPAHGAEWPAAATVPDAVEVTVTAGFEDGEVPPDLIQAMKLLIVHWWLNREAVVTGTIATEMPLGVAMLIEPHRMITL